MPTLEQIKQRSLQMPSKPKSSNSKKILKIIVGIALAWFTYTHFVPKKLVNIPEGAYAQSHFKELFDTPYKKVVWLGADCPVSKYRKNAINAMMKQTQLNRYYQHRPFLQYSLSIDGNDKIGHFIIHNCSANICIINPPLGKIIKTNEKKLVSDLNKYIIDENWQEAPMFGF